MSSSEKIKEKLELLANEFPYIEDSKLIQLNKFITQSQEVKELISDYFLYPLMERDNNNFYYLNDFSNFCLKYNLIFFGKEFISFCTQINLKPENNQQISLISKAIEIACEFNFEEYLRLDNNAERIRLCVADNSIAIDLNDLSAEIQFLVLQKLYLMSVNKIFTEQDNYEEPIREYSRIISIIRGLDKEILKNNRQFRIFSSNNLSFSKETKTLFDEEINDPFLYDAKLYTKLNILLFPSFGEIQFKNQNISIKNEGNGCIRNPTLELHHYDMKLFELKIEHTILAGDTCIFSLDDNQIRKLQELDSNKKPLDLVLSFKKFNKLFKLYGSHNILNIQENIFIPNKLQNKSLLLDLIDMATRMLERKYQDGLYKIENLHNDFFVDKLRDNNYIVTDQTRSGRSSSGNDAGELDIMIRKENGTPVSIIEAFRLKSCGEENSEIASHINKLLHDYDTAGHEENYILVYAEASNFSKLWDNYLEYVKNLNSKKGFVGKYELESFEDTEKGFSSKTDIRVGLAKHKRENYLVKIYHIFMNLYKG
jgi:hypothetical protein